MYITIYYYNNIAFAGPYQRGGDGNAVPFREEVAGVNGHRPVIHYGCDNGGGTAHFRAGLMIEVAECAMTSFFATAAQAGTLSPGHCRDRCATAALARAENGSVEHLYSEVSDERRGTSALPVADGVSGNGLPASVHGSVTSSAGTSTGAGAGAGTGTNVATAATTTGPVGGNRLPGSEVSPDNTYESVSLTAD